MVMYNTHMFLEVLSGVISALLPWVREDLVGLTHLLEDDLFLLPLLHCGRGMPVCRGRGGMKVGGVQYCCLGKWLHKCTEEAIQGYSMHHMTHGTCALTEIRRNVHVLYLHLPPI